jgi:hypothetical protein
VGGLPLPRSLAKLREAPFRQGRFYQPQYSTQRCSRKVIESAGGMRVVRRRWKKGLRSKQVCGLTGFGVEESWGTVVVFEES